jgi:hypothetical protein
MPDAEGRVSAEIKRGFMFIPDKGDGEQKSAVSSQDTVDFFQELLWIEHMFKDLDGNRCIKAFIFKRKAMTIIVIVSSFVFAVFRGVNFKADIFRRRTKMLVGLYPTADVQGPAYNV